MFFNTLQYNIEIKCQPFLCLTQFLDDLRKCFKKFSFRKLDNQTIHLILILVTFSRIAFNVANAVFATNISRRQNFPSITYLFYAIVQFLSNSRPDQIINRIIWFYSEVYRVI